MQYSFHLVTLFILTLGCKSSKTANNYIKKVDLYRISIHNDRTDQDELIFRFSNNSEEIAHLPSGLGMLGSILYVYTPSGMKLRHFRMSGSMVMVAPNTSHDIVFRMDHYLVQILKATENGWYRCVWEIEYSNSTLQTEAKFNYDYNAALKRYDLE